MLEHFGKRRSHVLTVPFQDLGNMSKDDPDTVSLFDIDPGSKGRLIAERGG